MTDANTPEDMPQHDQLFSEASLWFARMRGPDAEAFRPEFDRWLARGAAHLGAYNRAAEVFNIGKFLAEPGQGLDDVSEAPPPRHRWPYALVAGGLALVVMFAVWFAAAHPVLLGYRGVPEIATDRGTGSATTPQLVTGPTDRRDFALADGSSVTLEPGSRLTVAFTAQQRSLRLLQGRGRFDVAHEARPFIVYVGRGSVTAHGTVFDVAIDDRQKVTVQLLRGAIDVALPAPTESKVRRLMPGQTIQFDGDTTALAAAAPKLKLPERDAAPEAPELREFDNTSVADVLAIVNARSEVPIRLADPSIGDLRVSGRFSLGDAQKLADRLALLFNLIVDRSDPSIIRLRRP